MPKIRITSKDYGSLFDKVVEVKEIDRDGDAHLFDNEEDFSYCFAGEFDEVSEDFPIDGYTLTIKLYAENVLDLYEILDSLPEDVLSSAVLDKN